MSDLNYYKITGLSDTVQFGKDGGFIKYSSVDSQFYLTQNDEITPAPIEGSNLIGTNNVIVTGATGTLSIIDASIGYDSAEVLQFLGSKAFIVPVGDNSSRPTVPKLGMFRLNIESTPYLEIYNGTQWQNMLQASAAGSSTQIQYNNNGILGASSRFTLSFDEAQSTTTLQLGDPASYSNTATLASSIAYIDGASSSSDRQGTNIKIRGGNNSGTGNGGSVTISGGYSITSGMYAGSVALMGGESSVGNHGHVLAYTINSTGGTEERLRIAGGTGAWGLGGPNYGNAGQVLTSNGYNDPPTWQTVAGLVKQPFAFNSNSTTYITVIPTDGVIMSISIIIISAFDDPATTITVGDAAVSDRLFAASDNLPGVIGSYTVYPNYVYGASTQITLTLTGSSAAGSGVVTVSYE